MSQFKSPFNQSSQPSQQTPYGQPGIYQQPNPQTFGSVPMSPVPQQVPPMQPMKPPKKRSRRNLWITIGVIVVLIIIISAATQNKGSNTTPTTQATQTVTQPPSQPTATPTQAPTPTPVPTQPPPPTQSPSQIEQAYKVSTTSTTVANLDKEGNNDLGNDVHFTATILNFVKDDSGNTAGANVSDPTTSGVIQVGFPAGTDVSQVNTGDTLEVWGQDEGTASGTNAFGATIQEVVISALYMTDQTTGYQAG